MQRISAKLFWGAPVAGAERSGEVDNTHARVRAVSAKSLIHLRDRIPDRFPPDQQSEVECWRDAETAKWLMSTPASDR
jgi:hypothetical protein